MQMIALSGVLTAYMTSGPMSSRRLRRRHQGPRSATLCHCWSFTEMVDGEGDE